MITQNFRLPSRPAAALLGIVLCAAAQPIWADSHADTGAQAENAGFSRTLRSVTVQDLVELGRITGVYEGSPQYQEHAAWFEKHFYDTLAARKVWKDGTSPATHERGGPITWDIVPIPQDPPPPCDQPQPTGYDAEGCRIVASMFTELEKTDPVQAAAMRAMVRRGRDTWFKGTFGNQDLNEIHLARTIGEENMHYAEWMHTKHRPYRFSKWGLINDPDCEQGDASTFWLDKCEDPKSTGVLGYRKYFKEPQYGPDGEVVFDPRSTPYTEGEMQKQQRFAIGHPCVQCHVAFDPTNPPANPNEPEWENITGHIGNQYVNQPLAAFLSAVPRDHFSVQAVAAARPGTVDTSLNPNDFMHNPGTQNNITDFMNKRVFQHEMKHPITGEMSTAPTLHVLKGGEDSVGERLALLRVYVNIGMCTEECWVPNFPVPGTFFGEDAAQKPMRIEQCARDCDAWNYADAKMPDMAMYLLAGGPFYLLNATDVDGTPGREFIDLEQVPQGRKVFARECAQCHSTRVPPETIVGDKDALEKFYEGHVFGAEAFWEYEFPAAVRNSEAFQRKYMQKDDQGRLRPAQFVRDGMFGQDWLGNDNPEPFNEIGTNSCRARHDNHNKGHIWEEFASETYQDRPSPGSVPRRFNRMVPGLGGRAFGTQDIGPGGPGYYRNISLLSVWSHAPFLHNNAIGELTYTEDGGIDTSVRGRIQQYHLAMDELLMSDDPSREPHRSPKITGTTEDIWLAPREDGQGLIKLPVRKGTPVAYFASSDPHAPLYQKCDDLVENKGHQFGIDLSRSDKDALTEFLKLM
nr:hypothetical protein [Oceanococcus sp. HetDA_MAG_MS8]